LTGSDSISRILTDDPYSRMEIAHIGIVVENLEEGIGELRRTLGIPWGAVQHSVIVRETKSGPRKFHGQFALSLSGPPHWELIARQDDSPWSSLGFNHLAIWCDDLERESDRRVEEGWTWESGKYFLTPEGVRYELVPRGLYAPRLARYLAGGPFFEDDSEKQQSDTHG
jgi:hypothetical protein